jgi:hypothetical protein
MKVFKLELLGGDVKIQVEVNAKKIEYLIVFESLGEPNLIMIHVEDPQKTLDQLTCSKLCRLASLFKSGIRFDFPCRLIDILP